MVYKIYREQEEINTIVADEKFIQFYCETNGYTYESQEVQEREEMQEETTVYDELAAAYREGVQEA